MTDAPSDRPPAPRTTSASPSKRNFSLEKILEELVHATASQNAELNELTTQVARQGDVVNEIRRHGQSVAKSVSWDNLGDHVYRGVAKGVETKIEHVTSQNERMDKLAKAMLMAVEAQDQVIRDLLHAGNDLRDKSAWAERAARGLETASEDIRKANRGKIATAIAVGVLCAVLGSAIGYFAASPINTYMVLKETGERIRADASDPIAINDCITLSGEITSNKAGKPVCAIWQEME